MSLDPVEHFRTIAPLYMRSLLKDFPELTVLDAAAIFGNAGHESKGLTDDQEDAPTVKGSRGGLNWMQWTGPRRRALEAYAERNKLDPAGDTAAYKWLFVELKGDEKNALNAIRRAKTLRGKVEAFEKAFLRAGVKHYPSRTIWAERALAAYNASDTVQKPEAVKPSPVTPAKPSVDHIPDAPPRPSNGIAAVIGAFILVVGAGVAYAWEAVTAVFCGVWPWC